MLAIIVALDGKDTVKAMQSWANYAEALLADDPEKPPREDEFFHSQTTGGRYAANGNFAAVTGAVIAKAIELAETDNPRDNDTRSPAQRRGEALADVCNFYVDYQHRVATDPDADAPVVPKKRNWPQLIGVTDHRRDGEPGGGAAPQRAPHRPPSLRSPLLHRAAPATGTRRATGRSAATR